MKSPYRLVRAPITELQKTIALDSAHATGSPPAPRQLAPRGASPVPCPLRHRRRASLSPARRARGSGARLLRLDPGDLLDALDVATALEVRGEELADAGPRHLDPSHPGAH